MSRTYRTAIVGATGAVGMKFIECLERRNFPVSDLTLYASPGSVGKVLHFKNKPHRIVGLTPAAVESFDFAFFSAGSAVSREYAPLFAKKGAVVIDNSSAWRMDSDVPLVVPEVNPHDIPLHKKKGIIANPNCSIIGIVVAVKALHDRAKIRRMVISTYQAVSGAGARALSEFEEENRSVLLKDGLSKRTIFPRPMAFNCIPQVPQKDAYLPSGFTSEEQKLVDESRKILGDASIKVAPTCVRVPVANAHSASVAIETERKLTAADVVQLLSKAPGVVVRAKQEEFPTPLEVSGKDETYVGRIREDESVANGILLWVVSDNILKGAALNAVQIAEVMIR